MSEKAELPNCSVKGCPNKSDPRWYVYRKDKKPEDPSMTLPACDGHGSGYLWDNELNLPELSPYHKARQVFNNYAALDFPLLPVNELSATQVKLARWESNNIKSSFDAPALGMAEELGEAADILVNQLMMASGIGKVAKAHLKNSQGIRGMTRDQMREKVADGLADVLIFACQEATRQRIDLFTLLTETVRQVMGRDWIADPDKGGQ